MLIYTLLAFISYASRDPWSFSTTIWMPVMVVMAVLWCSSGREWPVWLVTAGLLHLLSGFWVGRPPLLAAIFAIFDLLVLPLCVMALRTRPRLWSASDYHVPIIAPLIDSLVIALVVFTGSVLLSWSLILAGYPVAWLHSISWAQAALTSILAILPLLQCWQATQPRFGGRAAELIGLNMILMLASAFFAWPPWAGMMPLWLQFSSLLLTTFALSGRTVAGLLLLQYCMVMIATRQGWGVFFQAMPSTIAASWQAQWYLIFSSFIINCLLQFMAYHRQRINLANTEQSLIARFSSTATLLRFDLTMPEGKLHWYGSPEAFFPEENMRIETLTLLDAHCEASFLPAFSQWYAGNLQDPFSQTVTIRQLNGDVMRCQLIIQSVTDQQQLVAGLARLLSD